MLLNDVYSLMNLHTIPMVECSYLATAEEIQKKHTNAKFVYIQPKSIEDLSLRIIRKRPGTETESSLSNKMNYAFREIEHARGCDWIDHVFTNDELEEFLGKVGAFLVQ